MAERMILEVHLARLWLGVCGLAQSLRTVALAQPGGGPLEERHTVPTLVICLAGVGRIAMARGHCDLQVGQALLIPPGVPHTHVTLRSGSAMLGIGFMVGWADLEIATPSRTWLLTMPEAPMRALLASACRAAAAERLRLVRQALATIAEDAVQPMAPMPDPVRRMWTYLRRERLTPIRARDVLRASGLRPSRAHALFRSWFGATPLHLLRRHRLEYAQYLLAGGATVTAAAAACGFRSRRHLTAACQAVHRRPPSRLTASMA